MHAFVSTKIVARLEIDMKVLIGPCECEIQFIVVNIPTVFNLLLSQPYIHTVDAVPFSLHQKVKFISRNKLIFVMAEEDLIVPSYALVPFIKAQQIDHTSRYHSFEFAAVNYIPEGKLIPEPNLLNIEHMIGRYLKNHQYKAGTGFDTYKDSEGM